MSTTSRAHRAALCEQPDSTSSAHDSSWFSLATSWHLPVTRTSQVRVGGSNEAYAIPLSDGHHILFTDNMTGLLCMGAERPTGSAQKLARKFTFEPRAVMPLDTVLNPTVYAVAEDLTNGARIVAAYGDRIVLYSVSVDALNYLIAEQERTLLDSPEQPF